MKKLISLLSILLLSYSTIFAQTNSDGSFALKKRMGIIILKLKLTIRFRLK